MQNEIAILKVSKFKTVALVTVTYRKADGTTAVSSGKTEAEAIANINAVVPVKVYDFAPLPKRSNSGSSFRNNNGTMTEVWKKSKKKVDSKSHFLYLNNMTNDFANISAESNMSDMITLSMEEIAEANAWFDARNAEMDNDEIPMSF